MKTYQANGKNYTQDEIIVIHAIWQDIQERYNVKDGMELALVMIGDDEASEYVHNNQNGGFGKMNA